MSHYTCRKTQCTIRGFLQYVMLCVINAYTFHFIKYLVFGKYRRVNPKNIRIYIYIVKLLS